jgi:predicted amidophosphoribosyltransferase
MYSICKQCKTKIATNGELCNYCIEENNEEFEKCKANPYYFATKYFTLNSNKFTTMLTEEEFNNRISKIFRRR